MRRQNPPQASLGNVLEIEKYASPLAIVAANTLCAAVVFGVLELLLALLFAILVDGGVLNPSAITLTLFAGIALAAGWLAVKAFRSRPEEPTSESSASVTTFRPRPMELEADRCSFKILLISGDTACVNVSFFYPKEDHTEDVKARLNVFVRAALQRTCSMRSYLPSDGEILSEIDDTLKIVAAEFEIPVLYAELRETRKIGDANSRADAAPSKHLGTGTLGLI